MAKLKRNAIVICGLALFFTWAFYFAKHDPVLRTIIPFGEDPYDAVGSFGVIAALLLALTSLARAFFPALAGRGGAAIYVLRVQSAVAFCVLVTIASDIVAMGRHTSMWTGAAGRETLLILLGALIASSIATLALTRNAHESGTLPQYTQAACVWLGSLFVLYIYPESIIAGIVGHLLTVVLADLLLFAPVAMLVRAWLPSPFDSRKLSDQKRTHIRYLPLAAAAATGLIVGAIAFLAEMSEGGPTPPFTRLLFVAAVYLGLAMAGLMIGYACLGRLLGFALNGPVIRPRHSR